MDHKILIIGIGNNTRGDDGLGWAFIERIRHECPFDIEYRYQLQVEDAELISHYERVIFVDATRENIIDGISFKLLRPEKNFSITTHRLDPSAILWICDDLYDHCPEAFLLAIQGVRWDLGKPISERAKKNLEHSIVFFKKLIQEYNHEEDRTRIQMTE